MNRYSFVAIACLGIVLVFSLRPWRSAPEENFKDQDAHRLIITADESPLTSSGSAESARTKPRPRSTHPKPTIEETTTLARTTIIPLLDLPPDQPLPERVAQINELIRATGVESDRLRIIIRSADPALDLRSMNQLKFREIPLGIALKYLCDSTKLRYHVRENGIVELTTSQDPDPAPRAAEPESSNGDSSAREEVDPIDPFAEPVPTR